MVVLELSRAGICGTDVHEFLHGPHLMPAGRPVVIGHEMLGRVVDRGTGVSLELGQRVVPGAGLWCGGCRWCRSGRTNLCATYSTFGLQADGGLAEFVAVPEMMCHAVPDGCEDRNAVLAQPMAVAQHSVSRGRAAEGERVLVIGAGGIGAFVVAAVRSRGVGPLVVADVSPQRLETAARLGADPKWLTRAREALEQILDLTGGGADLVIEASGSGAGLAAALAAVARGGRLLLVGLQSQPRAIDLHRMVIHEIEIFTTNAHVCDADLPAAIALLAERDLAALVVDREIPLERLVPDGLLAMAGGQATGKVIVNPTRRS